MDRAELYAYAKTHEVLPGVKPLLTAIDEATGEMRHALSTLNTSIDLRLKALDGFGVDPMICAKAIHYQVACGKYNTLFLTLACVLEAAGHKVDY